MFSQNSSKVGKEKELFKQKASLTQEFAKLRAAGFMRNLLIRGRMPSAL